MSDLIDRQAFRAAHGLGTDCNDCKRDMKSCQYDREYSLMDFCEWIDDAPTAPRWHRVEDELPDRDDAYVVGWRYPNGCFYWGKVLFFNDKWQVDEEIPTPDYWMPIEPPKEDNNG